VADVPPGSVKRSGGYTVGNNGDYFAAAGVDEAVDDAGGVAVEARDLPLSLAPKAVILVASGTLMGVNTPAWSRKPWDPLHSTSLRRRP
jgi:hypothetical protein